MRAVGSYCTDISRCAVNKTLSLKLIVSRIILLFITQCLQQLRRTEDEEGNHNLYAEPQDKQQNSTSN